jgi:hypothetical protein
LGKPKFETRKSQTPSQREPQGGEPAVWGELLVGGPRKACAPARPWGTNCAGRTGDGRSEIYGETVEMEAVVKLLPLGTQMTKGVLLIALICTIVLTIRTLASRRRFLLRYSDSRGVFHVAQIV